MTEFRVRQRNSRAEAGFTLVEVLIAIVVLVFGLIAVTNLMIVAASSNTVANQMTGATAAASRKLEDLKATPFTNLVASPAGPPYDFTGFHTAPCAAYCREDAAAGLGIVRTRWQIVAIPGDNEVLFIHVRSEGTGALTRGRSAAEFTTFRACTDTGVGCPQ